MILPNLVYLFALTFFDGDITIKGQKNVYRKSGIYARLTKQKRLHL